MSRVAPSRRQLLDLLRRPPVLDRSDATAVDPCGPLGPLGGEDLQDLRDPHDAAGHSRMPIGEVEGTPGERDR